MSKKDYTKYNKQKEVTEAVVTDTPVVEQTVDVVETPDVPVKEEVKEQKGIVCNCSQLNVRRKPFPNSEVLGVIKKSTEVIIDLEKSKKDFYKVCTPAGIEGFCMKDYINLV